MKLLQNKKVFLSLKVNTWTVQTTSHATRKGENVSWFIWSIKTKSSPTVINTYISDACHMSTTNLLQLLWMKHNKTISGQRWQIYFADTVIKWMHFINLSLLAVFLDSKSEIFYLQKIKTIQPKVFSPDAQLLEAMILTTLSPELENFSDLTTQKNNFITNAVCTIEEINM